MAPARSTVKEQSDKRPKNDAGTTLRRDESANDEVPDKDETEEKLEKLVFGDDAGFLEGLKRISPDQQLTVIRDTSDEEAEDEEHGAIADENLFFLDSGAEPLPDTTYKTGDLDVDTDASQKPAWEDSDDDRLYVSLASNAQLRKLRNAEGEDVVNGREYIKRLRRQYEHLHPSPAWARRSSDGQSRLRRRSHSPGSQSGVSDDDASSDVSIDDDITAHPPTQALADLLRTVGPLTRTTLSLERPKKRRKLRPEVLDIERTKDIIAKGPSSVDSLQFHPYYPLIVSSGPSSTISVHHISPHPPNPNPLLTSLHVKNTPLHSTAFLPSLNKSPTSNHNLPDSTTIYLSSRRRYFHTWSLTTGTVTKISRPFTTTPHLRITQRTAESFYLSPCGRYIGFIGSARKGGGYVNVFSTTTLQWVCTCRIDSRGGVADFSWWRDGNGFVVAGKNGECSEYDIQERKVLGRWVDEGAVGTTVIALGGEIPVVNKSGTKEAGKFLGGDRYVAVGSSSGIVNIYDRGQWSNTSIPTNPTPLRALTHLTTPTSHLVLSSDGQMLVMASRWKKDALCLVHLPSCTVYRNWPTDRTPLGRVSSVALSPDGALLAVGNEQGAIRLWEIRE